CYLNGPEFWKLQMIMRDKYSLCALIVPCRFQMAVSWAKHNQSGVIPSLLELEVYFLPDKLLAEGILNWDIQSLASEDEASISSEEGRALWPRLQQQQLQHVEKIQEKLRKGGQTQQLEAQNWDSDKTTNVQSNKTRVVLINPTPFEKSEPKA
ncbi:hypothetical protein ACJX0J_020481, partial [Zea mays]